MTSITHTIKFSESRSRMCFAGEDALAKDASALLTDKSTVEVDIDMTNEGRIDCVRVRADASKVIATTLCSRLHGCLESRIELRTYNLRVSIRVRRRGTDFQIGKSTRTSNAICSASARRAHANQLKQIRPFGSIVAVPYAVRH